MARVLSTDGFNVEPGMELTGLSLATFEQAVVASDLLTQALAVEGQGLPVSHLTLQHGAAINLSLPAYKYSSSEFKPIGQPIRLFRASTDGSALVTEREDDTQTALVFCQLPTDFTESDGRPSYFTGVNFAISRCPVRWQQGYRGEVKDGRCAACGVPYPRFDFHREQLETGEHRQHPPSGEVVVWELPGPDIGVTVLFRPEFERNILQALYFDQALLHLQPGSGIRVRFDGHQRSRQHPAGHLLDLGHWRGDRYIIWDGQNLRTGTRDEIFPLEELGDHKDMLTSCPDHLGGSYTTFEFRRIYLHATDALSQLRSAEAANDQVA